MNWLNKFMSGRYGADQLAVALIVLSAILTFTGNLAKISVLSYLSYVPMALCIFRMLSRNVQKRRAENYKFVTLMGPVSTWSRKKINMLADQKHRYFKCPYCKAQLRLPKGKGKIKISCPVCKKEFIKKT